MTREKKELFKKLEAIDEAEHLDMSIGPVGPNYFDKLEDLRTPIYERLNVLMHGRLNDFFGACVI